MTEAVAIDFFTVPTLKFRTLYVFVILSLDRRRVVHLNVTSSPTAEWTSLQLTQAFPFDTAPRFLIRDRDGIYGKMVVFNARHLRKVLRQYLGYYQESGTHLGLDKDCPVSREIQGPEIGEIKSKPVLGGLHHRYFREAA